MIRVPDVGPPPPYDAECAVVIAGPSPFPPLTRESIPAFRTALATVTPAADPETLRKNGRYEVIERDVPGPTDAPALSLIICRPTATTAATPVLYYIHGGGMFSGSAWDNLSEMLDLASTVGATLVSIDYRLAPETSHPGPIEDCYAGLQWISSNAHELGIDPRRIVTVGISAGGGLAAALTLLARDRSGPALFGQMLLCPMLDDRNDSYSVRQMASTPVWNQAMNEVGWSALLGENHGTGEVPAYAAPARAVDLSALPPTFIDVGSADSFRDEDVAYAGRIWAAGGTAELHVWPGGYHGFDSIAPHAELSIAAVRARHSWLQRLITAKNR